MKRSVLLIGLLAAVAVCAGAQTTIDFHEMAIAKTPSPMPDLYPEGINLTWDHFYYVTPGMWPGAGPGFVPDPSALHNSVAFFGGPLCTLAIPCHGAIKLNQFPGSAPITYFTPVSAILSAGWQPSKVTVTAYSTSTFIGTTVWSLTNEPTTFYFPASWKHVTQLVFTPEAIHSNAVRPAIYPNAVYPKAGSLVMYNFVVIKP